LSIVIEASDAPRSRPRNAPIHKKEEKDFTFDRWRFGGTLYRLVHESKGIREVHGHSVCVGEENMIEIDQDDLLIQISDQNQDGDDEVSFKIVSKLLRWTCQKGCTELQSRFNGCCF